MSWPADRMRVVDVKLFINAFQLDEVRAHETYLCPECGDYHDRVLHGAAAVAARLTELAQGLTFIAPLPNLNKN